MAAKGGSQPSVSSDDVLMDLSDEEEQMRMEQWVEQQIIEAAEAARDSALAKEAKAAAPMENAYKQGADKWRVSEDVRKKVEAIKCSVHQGRTDKVQKSVKTKTHDKNVTEKTSSESDSDPFDRVLRIKKTRWREEGGSQPSCGAAAVSRERSHDQDGASHKRQKTGCSPLLSPRCPRDISPYMS